MKRLIHLLLVLLLVGPALNASPPAFFDEVDLTPLDRLGAKQGGRVVPLRSFAEMFVRDIHGTQPMRDLAGREVDSLAVLLECVLDPERAMEWCTVGSEGRAEARLAGEALEQLAFGIHEADAHHAGNLAVLEARLALIVFAADELIIVPDGSDTWVSMASIPDDSLASQRDRLIAAWRSEDVQTINAALADFASGIEQMQSEAGADQRVLRLERFWECVPILSIAVIGYFLTAVLASLGLRLPALWLIAGGLAVHLAGVSVRAVILHRLPVQNHYESMAAVAAMVALGALVAGRHRQTRSVLAVGSLLAAVLLGGAEWLEVPGRVLELEAGILSSTAILKYHVLTILAGYALIVLGAGVGGAVLVKRIRGATLEDVSGLHRLQTNIGYWVFWVLGLGILLGAVWADRAWGRWWAFDPKETWALITWLVYLGMVHIPASKLAAHRRPAVVALLHLLGLLAMLWTYFGVNLLLPSLHSYA